MRYLYQQLLAFWIVVAVTLLTTGVTFTQMTRRTIEEQNYQQLFRYAESAVKVTSALSESAPLADWEVLIQQSLKISEVMLKQQNVNLLFINHDEKIIYPVDFKNQKSFISSEDWAALENGKNQQFTARYDIFGKKEMTSYAMIPYYLNSKFYGALVVSQPAQNIQDTASEFTVNLFKGFALSSLAALIISYFYATFQVRRINRMREATRAVANGNFESILPVHDRDEFDELAADFNQMTTSLKESYEEIERQEERRRQFMADASHEMRTPLTTINGLLEGLEYQAIPENQKENAIRLMRNETQRLIRLVNENLDYEKIRTNQLTILIKQFNATEAIRQLLTQLETKASKANDSLVLVTQEDIDIFADYDRFIQIMVNIIQNAIQFTENGTITISLKKENQKTMVEIADTGIGMTEEQLKNIWDRYYKVDPSRKSNKFGESGLGLPIVQQLVRLHQGEIHVTSELGKGTTFYITFPDTESPSVSEE